MTTVAAYEKSLKLDQRAVCVALRKSIDAAMPKATSKVWHGSPVWFIGENPVVGYTARSTGVALLFWNGQAFGEPILESVGSFHAAQISYRSVSDLDRKPLARWLRKAKSDIWDAVAYRKQAMAKRKRNA